MKKIISFLLGTIVALYLSISVANDRVIGFSLTGGTIPPANAILVNLEFSNAIDDLCFEKAYFDNN